MIISDEQARDEALLPVQQLPEPREATRRPFAELLGPAFRQQNTIGSLGEAMSAGMERRQAQARARFNGSESAGYDPFRDLQGYEAYAGSFRDARSPEEVESIKRRIDRELEDRRILDEGGAMGLVAQVAAGVVDPINLVPIGGTAYRSARLGQSVLRGAARTGAAGAAVAAATEAGLQSTQETRTAAESAIAVGATALLSGILGGAAAAVGHGFPGLAARVERDLRVPPREVPDPVTEPGSIPLPTTGNAGAMRVAEMDARLKSALGVEKLVGFASPITRTLASPSDVVRRTAIELAETPFFLTDAARGIATPIAVERRARFWDAPLAESLQELDRLYTAHRQSDAATKLTFDEFRDAVGQAMREADTHHIPEVQQAARIFRSRVFDPLKDQAIKVGLLPADVETKGAPSYFTRVYNVGKIAADREEFVARLTRWFEGEQYARLDEATTQNQRADRFGAPPEMRADDRFVDPLELREAAEEVVDHILGVADGRIAYENVQLARGPLKERLLDVPDFWLEPYLESNVEMIAKMYTRTMASDVEVARQFGTVDMAERIGQIRDSYKDLISRAATEQERVALGKQRDADIRDLAAMRDRIRHTFAAPADPTSFFVRAGAFARNSAYLSLMGSAVISSIPDLARPVMVNGILRTLRDGVLPLIANFKRYRIASDEAKLAGAALDMVLHSRAQSLADIGDSYGRHSKFERGMQALVDRYGKYTLLSPWTAALKQFSAVIVQNNILRTVLKGEAMSAKEVERLAMSGIDADMAARIAKQFSEHGEAGTAWLANTRQWTDREAVKHFRAALAKDVDRTIVEPGVGDKPLWMSTGVGKVVGQFKTFAMASVQRVLIAGLQQRDMAVLNGTLLSVGLGMGLYALHGKGDKKELASEPAVWIREGIDRSGITGWLFEAGNIVEKLTRGTIGPRALSGGEVSLRYADRDVIGALLGPTLGRISEASRAIGAMSTGEFSRSDVRAVRRLIPFSNLWYLRQLIDAAEAGAAESLGAD